MASRWDRGWDVFVLGGHEIIGTSRCANHAEIVTTAEKVLVEADLTGDPFDLELVSGGRDFTF